MCLASAHMEIVFLLMGPFAIRRKCDKGLVDVLRIFPKIAVAATAKLLAKTHEIISQFWYAKLIGLLETQIFGS